jgi:hypothetical protein
MNGGLGAAAGAAHQRFSDCRRSCTNSKDCGFATLVTVVGRVVYNAAAALARAEALPVQLGHKKRPLLQRQA